MVLVLPMSEEKRCLACGAKESAKWIERQNIVGKKAYFCSKEHFLQYKKDASAKGVCEFC